MSAFAANAGEVPAAPHRASVWNATPESGASLSIVSGAKASGTSAGWVATMGRPNCCATP